MTRQEQLQHLVQYCFARFLSAPNEQEQLIWQKRHIVVIDELLDLDGDRTVQP